MVGVRPEKNLLQRWPVEEAKMPTTEQLRAARSVVLPALSGRQSIMAVESGSTHLLNRIFD